MPDRWTIALCLEYPLHQHGGVEVLVRELLPGLSQHFEILLVSGDEPEALEKSPLRGCWKEHFSWPTTTASRSDGERLARWLNEQRVRLAHFHFGGTYQWRARSMRHCPIPIVAKVGIPCVSTNHGAFSLFEFVGPQRPLWFKLAALPLFWPAKLWQVAHVKWEATVSNHDLNAVRRRFFPVAKKFLRIYHSRIRTDETAPLDPESGIQSPSSARSPVILCLGTVGRRKGQPYLVEAFGRIAEGHPDWKLVLAGRHAEADVSREIDDLINRHHLTGRVVLERDASDERVADLLKTSAIFAFPSLQEGLGLALQEAMFSGAACIGSATGGITDLIEDRRTGLLVPPANSAALAAGLDELISNPALRESLARIGRQSIPAKGMTRDLMVERHQSLYEKVIATSR